MQRLKKALKFLFSKERLAGYAIVVALAIFQFYGLKTLEPLRTFAFDTLQRLTYQDLEYVDADKRSVMIVDLDEDSLNELGQWPWPRHMLAILVQNLRQAGAAGIAFDTIFAEPDRLSPKNYAQQVNGMTKELAAELSKLPDNDEVFAYFLRRHPVVLGQSASYNDTSRNEGRPPRKYNFPVFNNKAEPTSLLNNFKSLTRNTPLLEDAARGVGTVTISPGHDGIVRKVPAVLRVGDQILPALSLELLRVASNQKGIALRGVSQGTGLQEVIVARQKIPTDIFGNMWLRAMPHEPGIYLSAADVITGKFDKAKVRGKLILFGTSAEGLKDIRATPLEKAMPGVEVHAQLIETILHQTYLYRPDWTLGAEFLLTLTLGIAMVLTVPLLGSLPALGLFATLSAGVMALSWYLFKENAILFDPLYTAISGGGLFLVLAYSNYAKEEAQKKQVRSAFGQYLSPDLVNQLAEEPDRLTLGGEMKELSILFCDVRGFTTISESYKENPQGLTQLINRLLTPLTDEIMQRRGTIDKYMGDCIMAFWNAPLDDADHAKHAAASALSMFDALAKLNSVREAEAAAEGIPFLPLNIGIGINTGEVVVGNMGSEQRFDYSVLGDAVNLAARLEGQSKGYGVNIVLGDATVQQLGDDFAVLELDLIAVKGKKEAVRIHTLHGDQAMRDSLAFQTLAPQHDSILEAYRRQDWDRAEALIEQCSQLDLAPLGYYAIIKQRISDYRLNSPGPEWDGVYVATTK